MQQLIIKPKNSKGRFAKIKNPKSESMRLTVEEKELILKRRKGIDRQCKSCLFWKRDSKYNSNYGSCLNSKFEYCETESDTEDDRVFYWDDEVYEALLETGQNFGCVHFKPK